MKCQFLISSSFKETEEILSAAIYFSPDDKKLKLLLGMCLVDSHSFKHATTILDALKRSIDLDASNSDCLCTMGDLYNILGDIKESAS